MSELKKVKSLFIKNAKQMWRDKVRMVSMLLFPLVMIGLFGSAVGSDASGLDTGVVYSEDSMYARQILQGFHSAQTFTVKRRAGNAYAGKDLIDSGELDVLVILPQNLKERIESGKQVHVQIMVDESNPQVASTSLAAAEQIVGKVSRKLSVRLVDGLEKRVTSIAQALEQSGEASKGLRKTVYTQQERIQEIRRSLQRTSNSLQGISTSLQKVENGLDQLAKGKVKVSKVDNLVDYTVLLVKKSNATSTQKKVILGNLSSVEDGIYAIQDVVQAQSSSASDLSRSLGKVQENTQSMSEGLEKSARSISKESETSPEEPLNQQNKNLDEVAKRSPSFFSNPVKFEQKVTYGKDLEYMDFLAPGIIALTIFMGAVMGLGRAIAGERKEGSLTRIFLTPTSNLSILLGTGLFYSGFEFTRGLIILFSSILLFGLTVKGSFLFIFLTLGIYALGSVGLGLFISSRVKSEGQFQAVSMIVAMPMMFISGVFFPIENTPGWLQTISKVMPMRYAADALRGIMVKDFGLQMILPELTFLSIFAVVTLTLGAIFFKREVIT